MAGVQRAGGDGGIFGPSAGVGSHDWRFGYKEGAGVGRYKWWEHVGYLLQAQVLIYLARF